MSDSRSATDPGATPVDSFASSVAPVEESSADASTDGAAAALGEVSFDASADATSTDSLGAPIVAADQARRGVLYALGAYTLWGLFPLYWKLLKTYPAVEILGQRVFWSFLFYAILLRRGGEWRAAFSVLRHPNSRWMILASSALIAVNWLMYIYAVNSGFVLESSLGYFITPLLNVLFGAVVLGERLSRWRWAAVGLAAIGVLALSWRTQGIPWIALVLAGSFSTYGLIRKRVQGPALAASTAETALLILPALLAIGWARTSAEAVPLTLTSLALFVFSGILTGVPLLWFAQAAQRMALSSLGFFQYIAPTIQFLIAVMVYREPFTFEHARGFGCIWLALALFSVESWCRRRR